ncbi:MAG: hypothetical protein ACIAQF_03955 [Phycisphaerales bacterium JB065]
MPTDREYVYEGPIEIRARNTIVIDGAFRTAIPDEPGAKGHDVVLSSMEGIIIRGDLDIGRGSDGSDLGQRGGDGGSLTLRAPVIVFNEQLHGGPGGRGGPGGGTGGNGGRVKVFGTFHGPYFLQVGEGAPEDQPADIVGGAGGPGGFAMQSDLYPEHRNGGSGGAGGSISTNLFKEAPWMVRFRFQYQLTPEELEALKAE